MKLKSWDIFRVRMIRTGLLGERGGAGGGDVWSTTEVGPNFSVVSRSHTGVHVESSIELHLDHHSSNFAH